jgi:hypothetical protein
MSEQYKGVLLFDQLEPKIHGYLILGNDHYQIVGEKISDIRTNLHIRKIVETTAQEDMFDEKAKAIRPSEASGHSPKNPLRMAARG